MEQIFTSSLESQKAVVSILKGNFRRNILRRHHYVCTHQSMIEQQDKIHHPAFSLYATQRFSPLAYTVVQKPQECQFSGAWM
jgi:uncharacterized protein (DUF1800 family)